MNYSFNIKFNHSDSSIIMNCANIIYKSIKCHSFLSSDSVFTRIGSGYAIKVIILKTILQFTSTIYSLFFVINHIP